MPDAETSHPARQVFLVDGSSFVFRAYFQSINQDRKYNVRSDGLPTGAVRLFCGKLLQFVRDGVQGVRPTHLAIVFDKSEGSARQEMFPDYKGHRPDAPDDLKSQMPLMREAVRAFGLIPVEKARFEADDLIATYAGEIAAGEGEALIVSADKDLMQLVGPRVSFYDFESGRPGNPGYRPERRLGPDEVAAYFGVPPEQVIDVQALAGDASDNVPGVPGIGVKTAATLVREHGSLEGVLAAAESGAITQPKRREALIAHAETARLSKRLVTLDGAVPLDVPLDDLALAEVDARALVAFLKAMEFTTITRRVAELYGIDPAAIAPDPRLARGAEAPGTTPEGELGASGGAGASGPPALSAARATAARDVPVDTAAYETVTSLDQLDAWIAEAREAGIVAFDTETTSLDAMEADLVGFSLGIAPNRAAYVPLAHVGDAGGDLFGPGMTLPGQVPAREALDRLKALLEDPSVLKVAQNLKYDGLVLARHGVEVRAADDTMLLSYVLDAGRGGHGMDELSVRHLGHKPIAFGEVAGTGRNFIGFARVPLDKATAYAAEDADVTLRLWRVLKPRLVAEGLATVYETLERPLVSVLERMERRGILVDRAVLSRLSGEFAQIIARVEEEVFDIAGERFTLGSPKQLGDILFGKLGLKGARKTATGQWSTTATLLEELAEESSHPLPKKVLEWRQLSKLKSTYTDALQEAIDAETGRVHTSYALAATTTGRLSSSDPNLQNIPIRTEEGRKIRAAFVAAPGHKLVSADYSQIELRAAGPHRRHPAIEARLCGGAGHPRDHRLRDVRRARRSRGAGPPAQGEDDQFRHHLRHLRLRPREPARHPE